MCQVKKLQKIKFEAIKNIFLFHLSNSLFSLIISFSTLNISQYIFSLKTSLLLTLVLLFLFNFVRNRKYLNVKKQKKFFIYFIFVIIISRFFEYNVFFYLNNTFDNTNISWLITIGFSFFIKIILLEFYKKI